MNNLQKINWQKRSEQLISYLVVTPDCNRKLFLSLSTTLDSVKKNWKLLVQLDLRQLEESCNNRNEILKVEFYCKLSVMIYLLKNV